MHCKGSGRADLQTKIPDAVCGDLDSVRADVLEYYVDKGMSISEDTDQYATDFTKCLRYLNKRKAKILKRRRAQNQRHSVQEVRSDNLDLFVFGGLGGRADQAFSQLHHLYSASENPELACGDIYLVTPESIIFLLHEGLNIIHTAMSRDQLGENVGIIPICRPSTISTEGLEWDVEGWRTEFGKQISTSNHIRSPIVKVHTSKPVLFTVEIAQEENIEDIEAQAKRHCHESVLDTTVERLTGVIEKVTGTLTKSSALANSIHKLSDAITRLEDQLATRNCQQIESTIA